MMTPNLFVFSNNNNNIYLTAIGLSPGGSGMLNNCEPAVVLEFYCLFPEHLGVLASEIQQFLTVSTIGLSLARFWKTFGISGVDG